VVAREEPMSATCPDPRPGLEVHTVDDGLVVFDAATDRVHYLNATATVVFSLCDGARTADQIADLVRAAWQMERAPRDEVTACIDQLRTEGVLQ
jgi:hypothetical protein